MVIIGYSYSVKKQRKARRRGAAPAQLVLFKPREGSAEVLAGGPKVLGLVRRTRPGLWSTSGIRFTSLCA